MVVCRDKVDASAAQHGVAKLLHHGITSEAISRFHNDRSDPVALDALEHRCGEQLLLAPPFRRRSR